MDKNATGQFIAALRKEKGYTQKELAEMLMVTDKAISRWETGKGLPDTSLLQPLCDILGVSVGELLSGEKYSEEQLKNQTDRIILESLHYSGRMLADAANILLLLAGIVLLLSPLFWTGASYAWLLGIVIVVLAALGRRTKKRNGFKRLSDRTYYLFALLFQGIAFLLELLPIGVVMVFAAGPDEQITQICSYFSLLPWGYAHFTPMLTGLLTVAALSLVTFSFIRFAKAHKCRKAAFLCSSFALFLSLAPLLLFGSIGMTAASYCVSAAIAASCCLQAVANRNSCPRKNNI